MLLVDKPAGMTSHDAVAKARRSLGERRIGHAGTLDPFATGLLVLLLGRGTRLLPYLDGEPKVYDAEIAFGSETATDDPTGAVIRSVPMSSRDVVERAIPSLTGRIAQMPPAYSAKRVGGRRAHAAARAGESLALRPVQVIVHRWDRVAWLDDALRVRITCSGGTYIRALARDLGRAAGTAAYLRSLRRVRSGPFAVTDARAPDDPHLADAALPLLAAIPSLPRVTLSAEDARRVAHGLRVPATTTTDGARAAMLSPDGALLAIAERADSEWQPKLVIA